MSKLVFEKTQWQLKNRQQSAAEKVSQLKEVLPMIAPPTQVSDAEGSDQGEQPVRETSQTQSNITYLKQRVHAYFLLTAGLLGTISSVALSIVKQKSRNEERFNQLFDLITEKLKKIKDDAGSFSILLTTTKEYLDSSQIFYKKHVNKHSHNGITIFDTKKNLQLYSIELQQGKIVFYEMYMRNVRSFGQVRAECETNPQEKRILGNRQLTLEKNKTLKILSAYQKEISVDSEDADHFLKKLEEVAKIPDKNFKIGPRYY